MKQSDCSSSIPRHKNENVIWQTNHLLIRKKCYKTLKIQALNLYKVLQNHVHRGKWKTEHNIKKQPGGKYKQSNWNTIKPHVYRVDPFLCIYIHIVLCIFFCSSFFIKFIGVTIVSILFLNSGLHTLYITYQTFQLFQLCNKTNSTKQTCGLKVTKQSNAKR